jgi:twitching motility protein PilT
MARIDSLLQQVQTLGASDLHLSVDTPPMVRLHGELTPLTTHPVTRELLEILFSEIMDDGLRARFTRDRDVDFGYEIPGVLRVRCNVFEQYRGIAGAFRVLPNEVIPLAGIGLPDHIIRLTEQPRGLIVVTGPPGTGKSTTLAALVDHINRTRRKHILTIEDPIEYRHANQLSMVTQREVGRHTPSFAQALRAALREDPDVIMVGEMRDPETMSLALTAAATGQLVLATVHTMNAQQTVDRIVDSFDGDRQSQARLMLAESLRAILAQRLLRRRDGTGRTLALEILIGNHAVSALIRERKAYQLTSVLQTSRREGMQTMDEALLKLVRDGVVNAEEAAVYASSREVVTEMTRPGTSPRPKIEEPEWDSHPLLPGQPPSSEAA